MIHASSKPADTPDSKERSGSGRRAGSLLDFLFILAACVILMFGVVRPFVAEIFLIPSGSMTPTLEVGDRVLAVKFAYRFTEPERGDLTVFQSPEGEISIKRIVGLPGDRVAVNDGVLFVNGERQRESYVNYRLVDSQFYGPAAVPAGHFLLMGDNRSNSRDSRTYGPVPERDLLGEVILRLWPLGRIATF